MYKGHDVWQCPPNGPGLTMLLMLNILSRFDLAKYPPLSVERFHLEAEAARIAQEVARGNLAVAVEVRPGDNLMIQRAISNLVSNAVRHTPQGGRIDVRIGERAGHTEVRVSNDGPGIPPDQREEVFKPFFRAEGSRNPETGGVGLGLGRSTGAQRTSSTSTSA